MISDFQDWSRIIWILRHVPKLKPISFSRPYISVFGFDSSRYFIVSTSTSGYSSRMWAATVPLVPLGALGWLIGKKPVFSKILHFFIQASYSFSVNSISSSRIRGFHFCADFTPSQISFRGFHLEDYTKRIPPRGFPFEDSASRIALRGFPLEDSISKIPFRGFHSISSSKVFLEHSTTKLHLKLD